MPVQLEVFRISLTIYSLIILNQSKIYPKKNI